jgi:hypothetical protein
MAVENAPIGSYCIVVKVAIFNLHSCLAIRINTRVSGEATEQQVLVLALRTVRGDFESRTGVVSVAHGPITSLKTKELRNVVAVDSPVVARTAREVGIVEVPVLTVIFAPF